MSAVTIVVVAVVANISLGEPKPPPGAADLSANDLAMLLTRSEMDPVEAEAIAAAKKRAYEKQLAAESRGNAKAAGELGSRSEKGTPLEPAVPAIPAGGGDTSVAQNKATGRAMNSIKGWSGCWSSLDALWTHESHWNERAANPSSGAYGIPQALPGSKMASAGSDWRTSARTQIAWGLNYVGARYGDPCKAWAFWQANNWY